MTYTTQQLQAMSDFEVNKALCIKLGYDVSGISEQRNMMTDAVTDYCNDPKDIMPLAFERGISLISLSDGYLASKIKDIYMTEGYRSLRFCDPSGEECADTNPLRAIACLILLMED